MGEELFMFRLKEAMIKKDISASELSRISGVGKSDISYYLKGRYVPKQDKCYMLAKALDVDPGWLMTGYGDIDISNTLRKIADAEEQLDDIPKTKEARSLAKGVDKMPKAQREAIMNLMIGLCPGIFEKENNDDDT